MYPVLRQRPVCFNFKENATSSVLSSKSNASQATGKSLTNLSNIDSSESLAMVSQFRGTRSHDVRYISQAAAMANFSFRKITGQQMSSVKGLPPLTLSPKKSTRITPKTRLRDLKHKPLKRPSTCLCSYKPGPFVRKKQDPLRKPNPWQSRKAFILNYKSRPTPGRQIGPYSSIKPFVPSV